MRITELAIDAFGLAREITIPLAAGLTLIAGENGTGKTTIHQFVNAILFGFALDDHPVLRGGRRGGTIRGVADDGTPFEIERHGDERRGGGGTLVVRRNGSVEPNASGALADLLGGVTRDVFGAVHAFDLDELTSFAHLTSDEIENRIYGASIGVAASILRIEGDLRGEQEGLWLPRGTRSMNGLADRIERLDADLAARNLPDEHRRLREQEHELESREHDLAAGIGELDEEEDHLALLADAAVAWRRARDARRDIAALPVEPDVPTAILTDEAARASALIGAERLVADARRARAAAQANLDGAAVPGTVIEHGPEIERLAGARATWAAVERDTADNRRRAGDLRARIEGTLAETAWDRARLAASDLAGFAGLRRDLSAHVRDDLDGPAGAVAGPRAARAAAEAALAEARAGLAGVDAAAAPLEGAGADDLEIALRAHEAARAAHVQATVRLQAWAPPATPSRGTVPAWLPLAGGAASAVGGLLVIAGAALPGGAALVLGLALIAAWLGLRGRRPAATPVPENPFAEAVREASSTLARTASAIGVEPGADLAPVRRAIASRREEERDAAIASDRAGAARALVAGREEALAIASADEEGAESALIAGRRRWTGFLADAGLPVELDRDGAVELVRRLEGARRELDELAALEIALAARTQEHDAWAARVREIGALLGRAGDNPGVLAEQLAGDLAAAVRARARRETLLAARDAALAAEEGAAGAVEAARAAHADLLAAAGVRDRAELEARHARSGERAQLADRLAQAAAALAERIPDADARDQVLAELPVFDPEAAAARRANLAAAIAARRAEAREITATLGRVRGEVARLEGEADATVTRQHRAEAAESLADQARRWLVRRVARELLETTRRHYEVRHRPAVLARAESLFCAWTDGVYCGLWVPQDGKLRGVVHAADNRDVPLAGLSRGTREQLYLAMRVALVEHLASIRERLPILIDDVLVNFDGRRAARVARTLEEISTHHQVLYLTCHETPLAADRTITLGPNVEIAATADRERRDGHLVADAGPRVP